MKKELIPAYLSGVSVNVPLFTVVVFLPTFISDLGASNFQIGLLSTFYFLVSILASPFWGALSDLLQNRKALALGSVVAFSGILLALSRSSSPTTVILLRACIGLAIPAFNAPLLAYISERTTTHRRGGDISWYNAFRAVGRTIGLYVAGFLTVFFPLSAIFWWFGFILLITLVPVALLPGNAFKVQVPKLGEILSEMKSRIFPKKGSQSLLREKGLIYLYASLTLRVICIVGFASFLPVYVVEELGYSLQFLGTFSAIGASVMIVGMLLAGYSSDALGRKWIVLFGLFLSALTPILYELGSELVVLLWVGRVTHSFGYSFLISGISAFVGDIAREREQGALMGWIRMAFSIGGVIGPTLMGLLLGPGGYVLAALTMSAFGFLGFLMALIKVGETTRAEERPNVRDFIKTLRDFF